MDNIGLKTAGKKSEKRPAFRLVFSGFLVTKPQAQYKLSLRFTGNSLVELGTVAGRPKAIGYAAPVLALACWRDKYLWLISS